ncbi:MAG: relaxase domain-containing protein [Propionibacteriaceae bacterium]|nr:relaxase domain-containing protein [Propionibacteriaceae bacterium]
MSAGDGFEYLLRSVAVGDGDRSLLSPLTRYYTESGCPPGSWLGSGVASLGGLLSVGDLVSEAQLQLLIGEGCHPVSGDPLGRAYPRYASVAERVDQRVSSLDPALSEVERSEAISQIRVEEVERGVRRAVAGFDYTFSVPKSVSVIWGVSDAGIQALIAQAHHDSVNDVLGFLERHILSTRTGTEARDGSIIHAEVTGAIATGFDHYDSRAGDPQLHTHVVVANKAQAIRDGKWRSLDSRAIHSSVVTVSALYNAVLADRLARVLGVGWEGRVRGGDRNLAWEVTGVSEDLVTAFSSRSRDIDAETDQLIAQYRAAHGRHPSKRAILAIRQQATLTTRPKKQLHSLAELTSRWRGQASELLDADASVWARELIAGSGPAAVVRADDIPPDLIDSVAGDVLGILAEKRSTWRRWNIHAEASRQTMGWRFASTSDREMLTELIVDAAEQQSLQLTPAELTAPDQFHRLDGTSVFRPKHMTVFSSQDLLDAEQRLLDLAQVFTAPTVSFDTIDQVTSTPDAHGRMLGADQREALSLVATSGRVVDVLVGPAGAGKTTTLASLRQAWESDHGPGSLVGLAPSATAAGVLGEDLGISCENTARWLTLHQHQGLSFRSDQLVIVDEASLAGTFTLDQITSLAAEAGAKVLLVGDWAQLQAVDAGGAFTMLVNQHPDPPELTDIHRFTHAWEKTASLGLRHGHPGVIDVYEAQGRLTEGELELVTQQAYEAWRDDTGKGLASLLIADSLDTVRDLNAQARHDRILTGQVDPTSEVMLGDGSRASAGDVVITRRNNRHLVAGKTGWVRNGDRWTIVKTHPDGAVTIRRAGHTRGGQVILPASYVAEHLDLGYAVTAFRAQGVTVDTSHVVVAPSTTRENLYVAMTRGRQSNHAWVAVDKPDDTHRWPQDNPDEATARTVLLGVLQNSGAELSAHQMIEEETERWSNITQLRAEIDTLIAAAHYDRWATLIRSCGLTDTQTEQTLSSDAFGALCAELEQVDLAGHNPETLLPRLVVARPLDGTDDVASVLHSRISHWLNQPHRSPSVSPRHMLGLIPPVTGIDDPVFHQAITERIDAVHERARTLLTRAIAEHLSWLARLGPRPADPHHAHQWEHTALAVAAYRDAWQVTTATPLGQPASGNQRRDAARISSMIRQLQPPTDMARPVPAVNNAPSL